MLLYVVAVPSSTQPRIKMHGGGWWVARLVRPAVRSRLTQGREGGREDGSPFGKDELSGDPVSKGGRATEGGARVAAAVVKPKRGERRQRPAEGGGVDGAGGQASFSFPNRQIHLSLPPNRSRRLLSESSFLLSTVSRSYSAFMHSFGGGSKKPCRFPCCRIQSHLQNTGSSSFDSYPSQPFPPFR